jgi:hypothetical protein
VIGRRRTQDDNFEPISNKRGVARQAPFNSRSPVKDNVRHRDPRCPLLPGDGVLALALHGASIAVARKDRQRGASLDDHERLGEVLLVGQG